MNDIHVIYHKTIFNTIIIWNNLFQLRPETSVYKTRNKGYESRGLSLQKEQQNQASK